MHKKESIAIILAGGHGRRLRTLTTTIAKPAIPFGGKHRLIDFSLSNCLNSRFDTIGVLMPPHPFELYNNFNWELCTGTTWKSTIHALPPSSGQAFKGTANAVYANIPFIEHYNPEFTLVLSGDHVYKMDYNPLIAYHKEKAAAATIAGVNVPWKDASRFGIMTTNPDGAILEFTEKPPKPKSTLASMGVYVFTWKILKKYLLQDEANISSSHDFGRNIIPAMLAAGERMYAYAFEGYWKDVGTVESLYEAHMDLLGNSPAFSLFDDKWPIYTTCPGKKAQNGLLVDTKRNLLFHDNCSISGVTEGTVVFSDVCINEASVVKNSVIMPGAIIGRGAYIEQAIIGPGVTVENGCILRGGINGASKIAVVSENTVLSSANRLLC